MMARCALSLTMALLFQALASAADSPPSALQAPQQDAQHCTLTLFASGSLVTQPDGRVAARSTLNGRPVLLLVDTGAPFGSITESMANVLQLRRRPLPYGMYFEFYNRRLETQSVKVSQFALGDRTGSDWDFPVMPDGILSYDLGGLIGANLMSAYDTDIDYYNEKINLFTTDHCPGRVVYWTQSAAARIPFQMDLAMHIQLPVQLDGKTVLATIDTGAAASAMTIERARALFGIEDTDPRLKKINSSESGYAFSNISFEGISVQNPEIYLVPQKDIAKAAPELLLGASILRQLHLYIAYKEKALYVTPAEAN